VKTLQVGFRTFGRTSLNYGMYLCLEHVHALPNVEVVSMAPHSARQCDVLLFSLFWWQHLFDYTEFLAEAKIDPRHSRSPLVILGGFQAFNLKGLGGLYHYACLGDGEDMLPAAVRAIAEGREDDVMDIPGCYWPGKEDVTTYQNVAFEGSAMAEPGQKVTRIEIARGCKCRCAFCALAHLKPYREGSLEQLVPLIEAAQTRRVALFAPDRLSHSQYGDLQECLDANNKSDNASDVRWDKLNLQHDYSGTILFGMEGLSERLRNAVGKPIPTDDLVQGFRGLVQNSPTGRRNFRFYLILDMPGETGADFEEFTDFLRRLNETPEAPDMIVTPFANTFLPNPHTPLQWAAVDLWGDHRATIEKAIWPRVQGGSRHVWRMKIAWTPRIWGPTSRLKSLLVCRGDERMETVFVNLVTNKKLRAQVKKSGDGGARALLRFCQSVGISEDDLCGEWVERRPLPWDLLRTHMPKDKLWKRWNAYRRVLGAGDGRTFAEVESARVPQAEPAG